MEILTEIQRVLTLEGNALLQCSTRIQAPEAQKNILKAISLLETALKGGGKIVLTGTGKSGKIAQKIAATLCSTGSLAVFIHPTEAIHGDLGLLRSGDVVWILSHTGNTDEVIRLVAPVQALHIPIISLTGFPKSRLAELSDVWLDAQIQEEACPHNLAPTTSTTLQLAWGDAIAVALMKKRGFKVEEFARVHPGGSLGRRLHLKVSEIMCSGDALPWVDENAPLDLVLQESTRAKLGAVLVGKKNQPLAGIITDGDIRRALLFREKIFQMKAHEIMTARPTTTLPEVLASEALQIMENRPSQISVLPVTDPQGHAIGLLRLHDIVGLF